MYKKFILLREEVDIPSPSKESKFIPKGKLNETKLKDGESESENGYVKISPLDSVTMQRLRNVPLDKPAKFRTNPRETHYESVVSGEKK